MSNTDIILSDTGMSNDPSRDLCLTALLLGLVSSITLLITCNSQLQRSKYIAKLYVKATLNAFRKKVKGYLKTLPLCLRNKEKKFLQPPHIFSTLVTISIQPL